MKHIVAKLVTLANELDVKGAYSEADQLTKIASQISEGHNYRFWVWDWIEGGYNGASAYYLGLDRDEALKKAKEDKESSTHHIDESTFKLVSFEERMRQVNDTASLQKPLKP